MGYTSSSAEGFSSHSTPPHTRSSSATSWPIGRGSLRRHHGPQDRTFDHLTNGRLALHIITGKTDDQQQGDGHFSSKTERYRRAAEYLELMKLTWSNEQRLDFTGEIYRVKGAASDVRPLQKPHPLLFRRCLGWRTRDGCQLCDVYAIYAEPLASTRERITNFRAQAAALGVRRA